MLTAFIYTDIVVIMELKRVKALRRNASTYSLFFLIWASIGVFFVTLIYLTNEWGADPTEYVSVLCWEKNSTLRRSAFVWHSHHLLPALL
jgi:hypothetical protein